jgi:hypothetical protein
MVQEVFVELFEHDARTGPGRRRSLLVHRRSGAVGAAGGAGPGTVQTRRGRKRAAACVKLTGSLSSGTLPSVRRRELER